MSYSVCDERVVGAGGVLRSLAGHTQTKAFQRACRRIISRVRDERERRLLLLRLRTAPGLLPALVALLLFYLALLLGAAVAVGLRALLQI